MRRLLLILFIGLAFWGASEYYAQKTRSKETLFDPLIFSITSKYNVDPFLVRAVIWRESRFNPNATGEAGERGLMQVMGIAASDWVIAEKIKQFQETDLFDPKTNIQAGTWYLARGLRRWKETDNPIPFALAEYNAGRGNVYRWIDPAQPLSSAAFIARIDYPGTKKYIEVISRKHIEYQHHYFRSPLMVQLNDWKSSFLKRLR
jgi:soluble lytic murein transglycosylase